MPKGIGDDGDILCLGLDEPSTGREFKGGRDIEIPIQVPTEFMTRIDFSVGIPIIKIGIHLLGDLRIEVDIELHPVLTQSVAVIDPWYNASEFGPSQKGNA